MMYVCMAAKKPILGLKTAFIWCIFGIERVKERAYRMGCGLHHNFLSGLWELAYERSGNARQKF